MIQQRIAGYVFAHHRGIDGRARAEEGIRPAHGEPHIPVFHVVSSVRKTSVIHVVQETVVEFEGSIIRPRTKCDRLVGIVVYRAEEVPIKCPHHGLAHVCPRLSAGKLCPAFNRTRGIRDKVGVLTSSGAGTICVPATGCRSYHCSEVASPGKVFGPCVIPVISPAPIGIAVFEVLQDHVSARHIDPFIP